MNASHRAVLGLSISLASLGTDAEAQGAPSPKLDTASLYQLQQFARRHDPRRRQLELLSEQSNLRLENIRADSKPTLLLESQAQYQSAVAEFPVTLPGGAVIPRPPHDTYDAHLSVNYKLFDRTPAPRRALERAQLAESQARMTSSLYPILQNVNDAFFAALRADAQGAEVETSITDLEAQIRVAATRVREGSALRSEENILRAELLRRRQTIAELAASRRAAVEVLADLTGRQLDTTAHFAMPDLAAEVARARIDIAGVKTRPEFDQFKRSREMIDRQRDLRAAQDKPRVDAYARVGNGRPGLNPLNNTFQTYWLSGVRATWAVPSWGITKRDREVLSIQQQISESDEKAFAESLQRATRQDLATIDRLETQLAEDDQIITLREAVAAEARARFTEAVITSAELIDRQTDVLSARLTRSVHRVELAQARARLLTTLGIETR